MGGCPIVLPPEGGWVGLRLTIRQPQGLRGALASPCLSPPSLESSGGAYMARGFLCVGICVQPAYTATATATAPPGRGVHSRGRKGCQTRRVSAACDSSSESGQDAAASERLRASNTCPDPMNPSPPQRYKERGPQARNAARALCRRVMRSLHCRARPAVHATLRPDCFIFRPPSIPLWSTRRTGIQQSLAVALLAHTKLSQFSAP